MSATGNVEIDFGAAPGSTYCETVVTGQAAILSGSAVEAFIMAEASTDHIAGNQIVAGALIRLTCGAVVAATGFTIYAVADQMLTGKFKVRWVWAD